MIIKYIKSTLQLPVLVLAYVPSTEIIGDWGWVLAMDAFKEGQLVRVILIIIHFLIQDLAIILCAIRLSVFLYRGKESANVFQRLLAHSLSDALFFTLSWSLQTHVSFILDRNRGHLGSS